MNTTYSESFAGIGAWGKAIKEVTARHEDTCSLKYYFEIDKYASNAFAAVQGESESLNLWDITQDIATPEVDIFFYSPPCQSFSIAGKNEGVKVDKGNLFWNALQKLKQSNPKYAIMENVKGLVSGEHKQTLSNMLKSLEDAGYFNYYQVMNCKDYGLAQNRERVFIVSIRKDIYDQGKRFEFPLPMKLIQPVADFVDYKLVVPKRILKSFNSNKGAFGDRFKTLNGDGNFMTVICKSAWAVITQNFYTRNLKTYSIEEVIRKNIIVYANTPSMNFKLQGFADEDYHRAVASYDKTFTAGKSDTQMYMRAGNSIPVNMIVEILENLLYDRKQLNSQIGLF